MSSTEAVIQEQPACLSATRGNRDCTGRAGESIKAFTSLRKSEKLHVDADILKLSHNSHCQIYSKECI